MLAVDWLICATAANKTVKPLLGCCGNPLVSVAVEPVLIMAGAICTPVLMHAARQHWPIPQSPAEIRKSLTLRCLQPPASAALATARMPIGNRCRVSLGRPCLVGSRQADTRTHAVTVGTTRAFFFVKGNSLSRGGCASRTDRRAPSAACAPHPAHTHPAGGREYR